MVLLPWVSLGDAIGDLPVLGERGGTDGFVRYSDPAQSDYQRKMRLGAEGFTLHRAKAVSAYAKSIISKIPPGDGIRSIPPEELPERFREMRTVASGALRRDCTTLYYRLSYDLPSYTITCYSSNVSSGAFTHPDADRAITVREAARLQTFPDRFRLDPRGVRRQLGNAVPPLMAQVIARCVMERLARADADEPARKAS